MKSLINSLDEAAKLIQKRKLQFKKLGYIIKVPDLYTQLAWENGHKSWETLKPFVEKKSQKWETTLIKMQTNLDNSFLAYLCEQHDLYEQSGKEFSTWTESKKLKKFINSFVEIINGSSKFIEPVNKECFLYRLNSLIYNLSYRSDEDNRKILAEENGFYFELNNRDKALLNIFQKYSSNILVKDLRFHAVILFPSAQDNEENCLEDFKALLFESKPTFLSDIIKK